MAVKYQGVFKEQTPSRVVLQLVPFLWEARVGSLASHLSFSPSILLRIIILSVVEGLKEGKHWVSLFIALALLKGGYSNEGYLNAFHTLGVPTPFLGTNYVDGFNYW